LFKHQFRCQQPLFQSIPSYFCSPSPMRNPLNADINMLYPKKQSTGVVLLRLCLALACLHIYIGMYAQNGYRFNTRKLTVKDGLVHQEVNISYQDRLGFIWLGTRFGLNRYDGYEFKSFTREKNGLGADHIDFITEDDAGRLWLFAYQSRGHKDRTINIDLMDAVTGKVVRFENTFPQAPFAIKKLRNYFTLPDGRLFFDAVDRFWTYDQKGFAPLALPTGFVPLATAGKQGYWGFTQQQVAVANEKGGLSLQGPTPPAPADGSWSLTAGLQFLYLTGKGYRTLQPFGKQPVIFPALPVSQNENDRPGQVHYDESKKLFWISWGRDLMAFDKNGNRIFQLSNSRTEPVERAISHLMTDRSGVTWAATQAGIWLISIRQDLFTRYLYTDPLTAPVNHKFYQCRGIFQTGNHLLVNTYLGDYRVPLNGGAAENIAPLQTGQDNRVNRFPIYRDRGNRLFTGINGIIELDPITGHELSIRINAPRRVWSLYKDRNNQMLLGCEKGLYVLGPGPQDTITAFTGYNGFRELAGHLIIHIMEDRQGKVWLLTNQGLFTYDAAKGITGRYSNTDKGNAYLPANKIQHLYADVDGWFWLATEGSGLIRWNPQTGAYQSFTKADGLSSNNIYAVYEDKKGFLWMSSDYGIIRMHKQNHQVTLYTPEDGITHYEFNRISHHQGPDGPLYFGGLNGVTAFSPEAIDTAQGPNMNTGVAIAGLQQLKSRNGVLEDMTAQLSVSGRIVMNPSDQFFILKLAAPDYINSDKTTFWYKVEGQDKEWTRNADNNIRIGRLPYGSYTLLVKAQLSNGNTTAETRIPLIVKKPIYLRWWFFVLAALLVALGVRWFYQWRIRQLQQRKQELETTVAARTHELEKDKATIEKQAKELMQLDEMKSKFFANVSHELRTPLTLLTGPIHKLLQHTDASQSDYTYLQLMQQNVHQLQSRVNEILDLSKLDAGKLELKEEAINIENFLQPVMASFESLALQKNINFLYRYRGTAQQVILMDGDQLKKILNNLLSNAFKFTPDGGQVLVTVHDNPGQLIFKVADTGVGIHPDEQQYVFNRFYQAKMGDAGVQGGTGIGLALTSELVALMKGRINLESEPGKGSTFIVELPRKRASYEKEAAIQSPTVASPRFAEAVKPVQKGASILLVEDNLSLQQYMQLELKDYRLTIASNGYDAVSKLEAMEQLPNLIISDIMMPMMDGFALLEKLKTTDVWRKIPVIMLTARADIQDKLTALRIGVDDYLVKPFITEELIARINNLLERYEARKNMQWLNEMQDTEEAADATTIEEDAPAPVQSAWLIQLESAVMGYLDRKESFTLDTLAETLFISKRQLQRNIKEETGLTANNYMKEMRLHRARLYLESKTFATVSEVSYAVGFNDQHYFSTQFAERFGRKPVDYMA
jgi:signal transduction histidine kinase/DNA-binding response OmpR family regulator